MATAIVYTEFGGPEVLTRTEVTIPPLGAGEIAVRVEAAGVNPIDAKLRAGRRASPELTGPRRVGSDAAGVVSAVGADVDGFLVGDEVIVFGASGTYASEIVVPQTDAQPRPPGVSAQVGAALGIPVGTAYQTLRALAVGRRDTLLVHGGSGSVGQAVIQYAVLWGATVVATSSERRFDRVRELGAIPVAYGEGLADRVRAVAPQGITAAIDAAGTDEALDVSVQLVADRDRIATLVRGADAASFGIRAFSGGSPRPLTEIQQRWRREAMPVTLALLAAGRFSVELGPSFPLEAAAAAHRAVEDGVDGKITLLP
ncbi:MULTISPECIES: NADP-dependent oxidoreductase [unclassified Microbacterium]|uniref:quinone oxidoreductase family protein n=1 Tax=unclassified Microbacterium TaxID=2609290 RepID=UPI00214D0B40|nr:MULTISPECIES: NADP-dependent oxidoreductase [unclassified Microbacterium]MCR2809632.1 NADP-dependent oxidoreductase [Microbacterium sp. zg.B185]WIM18044.1 NADP-dependent oxidoreductase [Microbacterium sp. zg-B185]